MPVSTEGARSDRSVKRGQRGAWRGPVTGAARRWAARPDVLADPEQRDGPLVWTTRHDVLGRVPREGEVVVAAWGDYTWTATVATAPDEADELWLTPAAEPVRLPNVTELHAAREVAQRIIHALNLHPEPERALELEGQIARSLLPVLADFQGLLDSFEDEVRLNRETARRILRELKSADPPKRVRKLLDGPVGEDLARLARLPR